MTASVATVANQTEKRLDMVKLNLSEENNDIERDRPINCVVGGTIPIPASITHSANGNSALLAFMFHIKRNHSFKLKI